MTAEYLTVAAVCFFFLLLVMCIVAVLVDIAADTHKFRAERKRQEKEVKFDKEIILTNYADKPPTLHNR